MLLNAENLFFYEYDLPVHPTDQNLVGEAHPAPELEAGVRHLPHQPPALQLAHRGQLGHVPDMIGEM